MYSVCILAFVIKSEITSNKQENAFRSHVRGTWEK